MTYTTGILAIWHDIDTDHQADVLSWYDHEHHAERVGIPGFNRARRYQSLGNGPEVFVCYDTESVDVLGSPQYLQRVNGPTEWTRRAMPYLRDNVRSACRVVHRSRGPEGAFVGTIRLSPQPGSEERLRENLLDHTFPRLHKRKALLGTQLWESDPALTTIHSAERDIRRIPDRTVDWVVVVSASTADQAEVLLSGPLASDELESSGAQPDSLHDLYQLQFQLVDHYAASVPKSK